MANRTFNQFQGSLEKGVVQLFAEVSFDPLGAPTLVRGKGIAGVVDNGSGEYTINLQDTYQRVLGMALVWKNNGLNNIRDAIMLGDGSAADPPYVDLAFFDSSGVGTAPTSGAALITLTLSNSTAL